MNRPGYSGDPFIESGCHGQLLQLAIIRLFQLNRWHVANRFKEATVFKPVHYANVAN